MAGQDFNINIRTLADLTGIQLTQQQLSALQSAAAAGNKDAIAALKKLSDAQKDAAAVARQAEQEFNYGIRAAGAYGLIIGGFVAKAINDFAAAQNKVTKELDDQGRSLVKNVQEWNKLTQASTSMAELATVGEKATAQIELLRTKFNEANSETLTLGQSVQDLLEKFATWTPFQPGSNQALLDERVKGLMQDLANEQQNAARVVKRGLDEQRDAHENIDAVIARETEHLAQQQALLRNIDPKTELQSWVAVEQTIERITKKLETLNAQRQKQVEAGEPTTKSGLLGKQEQDLGALSRSGQLTPAEQNVVGQQIIQTHAEKFNQDIKDRVDAFNKDIDDRNKRFTGGVSTGVPLPLGVAPPLGVPGVPVAGVPPSAGQSTSQTNEQLIQALKTVLDKYWGP